ncbi:hypothetical protein ACS5PN_26130 [Roseateles sp. NT4]
MSSTDDMATHTARRFRFDGPRLKRLLGSRWAKGVFAVGMVVKAGLLIAAVISAIGHA